MMTFLHCNKRLLFWIYLNIWASTFNPYESLSSTDDFYIKTDKWKLQKVKVKNDILEFNNKTSWLAFQLKTQCPWHLVKSPSRLTKCQNAWNQNLVVDEIGPLPPQLLQPPGLRLPGCSPPLQIPCPGHCQAGGPPSWSQTRFSQLRDHMLNFGRQLEENWCKKRSHLPGNLRSPG